MLNGIDPIIIFNFKVRFDLTQILGGALAPKIPVVASDNFTVVDLPLVPIYLSESLTGIFIDQESKSVDVDTTIDGLTDGGTPEINQRPISSTVKIDMVAGRSSLGVALFSAMTDLIFPKLTSKEYSITYLHGAVSVFNGLLHSFSISQNATDDKYNISMELIKPSAKTVAGSNNPFTPRATGPTPPTAGLDG